MAVIAVASLNSCGVYGSYSRPDSCNPTDSVLRQGVAYADSTAPSPVAWQQYFNDPMLQELIQTAIERNTDLNVARLQIEEAQATLMGAKLSYLPSLSLTPQAGISHYNGDTKRTYNLGASASWELDIFGKVTNAKREAAAALMQSQAYVKAVQTSLVATVAEAYYTLLMLDEQLAISEAMLALWDETITMLEALVDAGKANDVSVRQARASRKALEASILTLKKSVNETENSLSSLAKTPPGPVSRGKLDTQTVGERISTGVPLEALAARPDVMQAEAVLAQAFYATNLARSAFYPSITLSGSIGWTNNGGGSIINPGKWLSSALAGLTAPLFSKGSLTANLRIAKARQQEALLKFEQTLLDAGNEVNDAIIEWQTADGRMAFDRQQIEELEQAVDKIKWLVQYTSANYLEVLSAQQSLLNARLTLAQDTSSRIVAAIRLYHSLGGGA
ncbi:MAG: efflux transporter outer membrane subunit [Muribaculaceae bacterium]